VLDDLFCVTLVHREQRITLLECKELACNACALRGILTGRYKCDIDLYQPQLTLRAKFLIKIRIERLFRQWRIHVAGAQGYCYAFLP
jgi:hypothetical protein